MILVVGQDKQILYSAIPKFNSLGIGGLWLSIAQKRAGEGWVLNSTSNTTLHYVWIYVICDMWYVNSIESVVYRYNTWAKNTESAESTCLNSTNSFALLSSICWLLFKVNTSFSKSSNRVWLEVNQSRKWSMYYRTINTIIPRAHQHWCWQNWMQHFQC